MACCCTSPSATATATAGRYFSIHNSRSSQFRINTFPFLPSPSSTAACSIRFRVPRTTSLRHKPFTVSCTPTGTEQQQLDFQDPPPSSAVDCVGTGQDIECVAPFANEEQGQNGAVSLSSENNKEQEGESLKCLAEGLWELIVLVSPFFFWGTAMVAMKEVIPRTGPFFVSAFRLIPAGFLLIGFAASRGRQFPSGLNAWLSISLFALVDAACFQLTMKFIGSVLVVTFALVLASTSASDPDALQDLCVADTASGVKVNGFTCKDAAKVNASDFSSNILAKPGVAANTTFGSLVTGANVEKIPGLNTLGVSLARIDYAPGGLNPPHTHPRATEIVFVLEGQLDVGFITTSNVLISKTIYKGEIFVFPKGLVHFQKNNANEPAAVISAFNSQLPGTQSIPLTLFAATPPVPDNVLTKAFQVGTKEIEKIKSRLAPKK